MRPRARIVRAALAFGAMFFALALPRAALRANGLDFDVTSPSLSAFFRHPVVMRSEVLVPDDYGAHPERTYPAIYVVHAFGGSFRPTFREQRVWQRATQAAKTDFAIVFLDASYPSGHNEFADSANDGPWATALTAEFIPALESHVRLDSRPAGRFLCGHSSGGWSTLWLQINYPHYFGGVWAIAPDPVDFHDFTGPDLTQVPPPNFYRGPNGDWPLLRVRGRDTSSLRQYERIQAARGQGSQFDSFDAVFSPRGADGNPLPLFDRQSGAIDPSVAAYWEAHWDIAAVLRQRWAELGPQLTGKLNVFVGMQDTFHLESPVARLAAELRALGSDAHFTFAPGRDHWTIFGYDGGLIARIVREMAVRRAAQNG